MLIKNILFQSTGPLSIHIHFIPNDLPMKIAYIYFIPPRARLPTAGLAACSIGVLLKGEGWRWPFVAQPG
jgi:hypothetical protein